MKNGKNKRYKYKINVASVSNNWSEKTDADKCVMSHEEMRWKKSIIASKNSWIFFDGSNEIISAIWFERLGTMLICFNSAARFILSVPEQSKYSKMTKIREINLDQRIDTRPWGRSIFLSQWTKEKKLLSLRTTRLIDTQDIRVPRVIWPSRSNYLHQQPFLHHLGVRLSSSSSSGSYSWEKKPAKGWISVTSSEQVAPSMNFLGTARLLIRVVMTPKSLPWFGGIQRMVCPQLS